MSLTEREKVIAEKMRQMLAFIAREPPATASTDERVAHAWRVVGYAEGTAKIILDVLGESK